MPNPSTIAQREQDDTTIAYHYHNGMAHNLSLPKGPREDHLREARRLAEELGIEGPGPINGVPAQTIEPIQPVNALAVTSSIERELIREALVYYGILCDGREEVRAQLIRRLSE